MNRNSNLKQAKLLIGNILQFIIWIWAIINLFVSKPPFFEKTNFPITQKNLAGADTWFKFLFYLLFGLYLFFIVIIYFYKDKKYKKYWVICSALCFLVSGFALVEYNLLTDDYLVEYPKDQGRYVLIGDTLQSGIKDKIKEIQPISNYELVMGKGGHTDEIWTKNSIEKIKYTCMIYYFTAVGFIFLFLISGIQLLTTFKK